MEPVDLLGMLRRRWLPILLTTLVVLGAVAAITAMQPKLYSSKVDSFVKLEGGATAVELQAGSIYVLNQMPSYAALAETSAVLEPVAKELGDGSTAEQLAGEVKATSQPRSVIITVEAKDRDPARAARIADLTTQQLGKVMVDLAGGEGKNVSLAPIAPAKVSSAPSSPVWPVNLGAGGLLGLLTGLALGLIIDYATRSKRQQRSSRELSSERVVEPARAIDVDDDRMPVDVETRGTKDVETVRTKDTDAAEQDGDTAVRDESAPKRASKDDATSNGATAV